MISLRIVVLLSMVCFCSAGPAIKYAIQAAINAQRFRLAAQLSDSLIAKTFGVRYISGMSREGVPLDYTVVNDKLYKVMTGVTAGIPAAGAVSGVTYGVYKIGVEDNPSTRTDLSEVSDPGEVSSVIDLFSEMAKQSSIKWESIYSRRSSTERAKESSRIEESLRYETQGKPSLRSSFAKMIESSMSAKQSSESAFAKSMSTMSMAGGPGASKAAAGAAAAPKDSKQTQPASTAPSGAKSKRGEPPETTRSPLAPRTLPPPPADPVGELPPSNDTWTRPQEIPDGMPEYEYRLCQYDLMLQEGKHQPPFVLRPAPDGLRVDNVPGACVQLAILLLNDPQHEPHPAVPDVNSLHWHTIHEDDIEFLHEAFNVSMPKTENNTAVA